ncbi:MAG TPA: hypothetical protein VNI83_16220 [Vicinamibacterales bacterium]|nr:hypothetical protein [Vicinamibacterales bacterium]
MLKRGCVALVTGLLVSAASTALAQVSPADRLFVNVNGGLQMISKEFASTSEFTIYDEAARLTADQTIGNRPVFDGSVVYRLRGSLGVGVGISYYSDESDLAVTGQIPHPLFTNQYRVAAVTASGARHRSLATNLMAVWFVPFTTKVDFALSAGPSIVVVRQDLLSGVNIAPETGPSFATPTIDAVTVTEQRKTALGFNIGADAAYMLTPRYGAGFSLRYLWASADLPGLAEPLTVGGFQMLGGLRLRF